MTKKRENNDADNKRQYIHVSISVNAYIIKYYMNLYICV